MGKMLYFPFPCRQRAADVLYLSHKSHTGHNIPKKEQIMNITERMPEIALRLRTPKALVNGGRVTLSASPTVLDGVRCREGDAPTVYKCLRRAKS